MIFPDPRNPGSYGSGSVRIHQFLQIRIRGGHWVWRGMAVATPTFLAEWRYQLSPHQLSSKSKTIEFKTHLATPIFYFWLFLQHQHKNFATSNIFASTPLIRILLRKIARVRIRARRGMFQKVTGSKEEYDRGPLPPKWITQK